MFQLGIDMGSSTGKLALLEDGALRRSWLAAHQGELTQTLRRVRQDRHHPPRRGRPVPHPLRLRRGRRRPVCPRRVHGPRPQRLP